VYLNILIYLRNILCRLLYPRSQISSVRFTQILH